MISLDTPTKPSSAIASIIAKAGNEETADSKSTLSFAELLRGVTVKKDGEKILQNGLLVLSLADKPQKLQVKNEITILPENRDTLMQELAPLALNPKITKAMSIDALKNLIKDAKSYLKKQIIKNSDFKKSEIAALPKTLKGLIQVAKKFDINLSKVTIETIETKVDKKPSLNTIKTPRSQNTFNKSSNEDIVPLATKEIKNSPVEIKFKEVNIKEKVSLTDVAVKVTPSEVNVKKKVPLADIAVKITPNEVKIQDNIKAKDIQVEEKIVQPLMKKDSVKIPVEVVNIPQNKENKKVVTSELKKTPIFVAQKGVKEITTEQIVTTKINSVNLSTPKKKADNTLKLLLRTSKTIKNDTSANIGVDFSVATARVIAPSINKGPVQTLESLLHSDSKEESSTTLVKTEAFSLSKVDSFEVKLNEAKQMIKYISQDVKTAIQDYKSPFTRMKIQLNPQKLGEVDLTIVQRGKNLHINLSSNSVAINTLVTNINELKVQLNNSGINNATLNFNNNSQSSDSGAQQQQQQNRQHQREAEEEYNYFDNQERNEEVISSLEIVVPHYA